MPKLPARPSMGLKPPLQREIRATGLHTHRGRLFSTSTCLFQNDKPSDSSTSSSNAHKVTSPRRFRAAAANSKVQGLGGIVRVAGGGFGNVDAQAASRSPPAGARMARRVVPSSSPSTAGDEGKTLVRRVIAPDASQPGGGGGGGGAAAAAGRRSPTFARRAAPSLAQHRASGPRRPGISRGPRSSPRRRRTEKDDSKRRLTAAEERDAEKLFWLQREEAQVAPYLPKNPDGSIAKEGPVYVPEALKKEDLINNRIATMLGGGATQMSDVMGRLARRDDTRWVLDAPLARRLCSGQLVRFASLEEKERILALAEKYAESTAAKITRQKKKVVLKQDVGFEPVGGKEREKLVGKVLRGRYELHQLSKDEGKKQREQAVGTVEAALQLNGTWTPSKSREFLQKFESLWAAQAQQQQQDTAGKAARR